MSIQEGIHSEIIDDLSQQVESYEHSYQNNHSLSCDEMTIAQNLRQRKTTGDVVGYCNLDGVKAEMLQLENECQSIAEGRAS